MVLAYHSLPSHQPVYLLLTFLYSAQKKPLGSGSLFPLISARMGLLVLMAASLAAVQGFGLGPSLEWKAGDAEMWNQVKTIHLLDSNNSENQSLRRFSKWVVQTIL